MEAVDRDVHLNFYLSSMARLIRKAGGLVLSGRQLKVDVEREVVWPQIRVSLPDLRNLYSIPDHPDRFVGLVPPEKS